MQRGRRRGDGAHEQWVAEQPPGQSHAHVAKKGPDASRDLHGRELPPQHDTHNPTSQPQDVQRPPGRSPPREGEPRPRYERLKRCLTNVLPDFNTKISDFALIRWEEGMSKALFMENLTARGNISYIPPETFMQSSDPPGTASDVYR